MGANINYHTKLSLQLIDATDRAVKDFYNTNNIYIVYTKLDNISEQNPNVYDIDYNTVDVAKNTIKIDNIPNNYFNKNIKILKGEVYLENLLDIKPYVIYNDAELALSIFIAFKELMPK